MKKENLIPVLSIFLMIAANAQEWKVKDGNIYNNSAVILGDSTGNENSQLTIISNYDTYGGGGYGLLSRHSSNTNYLQFNTRSSVGYSSLWSSQAQCAAIQGLLKIGKDNSRSYDSHSAGGNFTIEFENYSPYNASNYIHFLGGTYSTIKGDISTYPKYSAIAAVIGNDQIRNKKTYGGYFIGKGYFSDSVGIGTDSPKAKVEVADGDIFISDINKGIIMKSPDGSCWRGTMDNSGQLVFTNVDCPVGTDELATQELKNKETNERVFVYPNPGNGEIQVDLNSNIKGEIRYFIYDIEGKLADKGELYTSKSSIDISFLNAGAYLIEIRDGKNNIIGNQKLIRK